MKYKEGDRVRCTGGDADMIGKVGTVIDSDPIGIVWVTPDIDPQDQWMMDEHEIELEAP